MGIDAAAHWGALEAMNQLGAKVAGRTVAIFAGGLDHCGPTTNMRLFEQICAQHGALVSECTPSTIPEPRRFLLRNRLIAALAYSVVVAQARLRSGALNTAGWANEMNRSAGRDHDTRACRVQQAHRRPAGVVALQHLGHRATVP